MHFYLPRRYRRQLLFPPGLLALAGLLWLGCVAVSAHSDRLKRRVVMQLTMPPLHCCRDIISLPEVLQRNGKVESFRPWHNLELIGNTDYDLQEQSKIIVAVRAIVADSMHAGGVRIKFTPTTHYKNLVFVLGLMARENVHKYWLDTQHKPTAFYAITEAYKPPDTTRIASPFACLLCDDIMHSTSPSPPAIPFWVRFDDRVTELWRLTWLQPLETPEWRASVWLLAVIGAVGSWRIIQTWRRA